MHTIAIVNEKGGTGKTTTAVNLSAALGELGHKVLLVDLDGQAASSRWLGVEDDTSFAEALYAGRGLKPIANVVPNVSLAPASGKLDAVAHDLRPTQGGQLRRLLNEVAETFEYTLIDCPPSLGNRLIGNALLAATHAIVPVETSILAMDGLKILLTTLDDVREGFAHNIILAGVLACRYDARTRLSRLVLEELKRALPGKVFQTVIRENVRMRECPASGQSILTYAPDSHAAEDYRAAAMELVTSPRLTTLADAGAGADLTAEMTAAEGDMKIGYVLRQSVRKSTRDCERAEQPIDWKESLEDAKRRLEAEGVLEPEPLASSSIEPPAASEAEPSIPNATGAMTVDSTVSSAEPASVGQAPAPSDTADAIQPPAETTPAVEPAPIVETPPAVEPLPATETPLAVETPFAADTPPVVETAPIPVIDPLPPLPPPAALETVAVAASTDDQPAEVADEQEAEAPAGASPLDAGGLSFRLDTTPVDRRAGLDAAPAPITAAESQTPGDGAKASEPLVVEPGLTPPQVWEQPAAETQTADDGVKPDCPHLRQVLQKMQWKKPDAPHEDKPVKKGLIARLLARNAGK